MGCADESVSSMVLDTYTVVCPWLTTVEAVQLASSATVRSGSQPSTKPPRNSSARFCVLQQGTSRLFQSRLARSQILQARLPSWHPPESRNKSRRSSSVFDSDMNWSPRNLLLAMDAITSDGILPQSGFLGPRYPCTQGHSSRWQPFGGNCSLPRSSRGDIHGA